MEAQNMEAQQTVFVVDDDDAVRDALELLMESVGLAVETFGSAQELLDTIDHSRRGCLILDIRMPGMSGLELQDRLVSDGFDLPVIFISGHGDVPMAVRSMRRGAMDFLLKPFNDQDLLDRIHQALKLDRGRKIELEHQQAIADRIATLTPREREVMDLVTEGYTNKVIANRLELSQRTVELHRAKVMEKMGAPSLAHLVRMVVQYESYDSGAGGA